MTNYDQYMLNEAYRHDDNYDKARKIWLVIVDENYVELTFPDVMKATEHFVGCQLDSGDNFKFELGWIFENDYDPNNFEYTYRLFNPTETFEV